MSSKICAVRRQNAQFRFNIDNSRAFRARMKCYYYYWRHYRRHHHSIFCGRAWECASIKNACRTKARPIRIDNFVNKWFVITPFALRSGTKTEIILWPPFTNKPIRMILFFFLSILSADKRYNIWFIIIIIIWYYRDRFTIWFVFSDFSIVH